MRVLKLRAMTSCVESAQEMANGTDPSSNEGSPESPTVPSQLGKRPRTGEALVSLLGDINPVPFEHAYAQH